MARHSRRSPRTARERARSTGTGRLLRSSPTAHECGTMGASLRHAARIFLGRYRALAQITNQAIEFAFVHRYTARRQFIEIALRERRLQ